MKKEDLKPMKIKGKGLNFTPSMHDKIIMGLIDLYYVPYICLPEILMTKSAMSKPN